MFLQGKTFLYDPEERKLDLKAFAESCYMKMGEWYIDDQKRSVCIVTWIYLPSPFANPPITPDKRTFFKTIASLDLIEIRSACREQMKRYKF